ncbi:MAG: flavodoxin family protein [Acidimicrobiia bacterium]|nr:flavodoxin family protein [Acidimicrobiia bacterium]
MARPRAVLVGAHPVVDSFSMALFAAAQEGLSSSYDVAALDLHRLGFDPVMGAEEWEAYVAGTPSPTGMLAEHAELVATADLLCFVYPTWWFGPPAMLKGWLDRVFMPGVSFTLDDTGRVRPALHQLSTVVGVSTYGALRTYTRFFADGGRRMLHRALRLNAPRRVRREWFGLYGMDGQDDEGRDRFLETVRSGMAAL